MKEFERSEKLMEKMFLDAFDNHVIVDATVRIEWSFSGVRKLKAYCPDTKTYLNFPTKLRRRHGQKFKADVIKVRKTSGTEYYRAYRGSIRDEQGTVVG